MKVISCWHATQPQQLQQCHQDINRSAAAALA
jgi:hypothetical protein